jgi:hypothetical protein
MTNITKLYDKMLELGEFKAEDLKDIDIGTSRIGTYIFYLRKKGLIELVGRGKYKLVSGGVIQHLQEIPAVTGQPIDRYEMLFGIELEMEYNESLIGHIDRNSYHSEESVGFNKYFIAENDGSLHGSSFVRSGTVELIGIPVTCSEMPLALDSVRKTMISRAKKKDKVINELNEVINFNGSTGAHMHISLKVAGSKDTVIDVRDDKTVTIKNGRTINPKIFVDVKFLKKISRAVKGRIKRELPNIYPEFSRAYFRGMAKRMTGNSINNHDRYQEWNFNPDHTIEYRSLNLHGVRTWNDLFKFYRIVCETINYVFKRELNGNKPFNTDNEFNVEVDDESYNFRNINNEDDVVIASNNINDEE